MRTTILLLFIALGLALGLQLAPARAFTTDSQENICATAAVIFCENFENRALGLAENVLGGGGFKNPGWGVSCCGTMNVINTQAFDGTKSMQWTYAVNGGAGFMDVALGSGHTEIYVRYYLKNSSNWVWSGNGNKEVFVGTNALAHNIMFDQGIFGDNNLAFNPQFSTNPTFHNQNAASISFPLNQWVCMELHLRMNTANQSNGLVEVWQGGTLTSSYTLNLDPAGGVFSYFSTSGYWNCTTGNLGGSPCDNSSQQNQHPLMYRWIDNIVVSTQRIGCLTGAGVTGDIVPPASPVGLSIH